MALTAAAEGVKDSVLKEPETDPLAIDDVLLGIPSDREEGDIPDRWNKTDDSEARESSLVSFRGYGFSWLGHRRARVKLSQIKRTGE